MTDADREWLADFMAEPHDPRPASAEEWVALFNEDAVACEELTDAMFPDEISELLGGGRGDDLECWRRILDDPELPRILIDAEDREIFGESVGEANDRIIEST